jgi:apolipoprotein N-acyltransferase
MPKTLAPVLLGCALATLSGVLLTLAFPPYDAWFLIWIACVPMAVAQHRVFPSRLSFLGPALGVSVFVAGYCGGLFPSAAAWYMKALPLLPLLVGGVAFMIGQRGRATRARTDYVLWPLGAAASWVALELLRSFVPVFGTWGFLGYALYRQSWLIQPVRVFGIFGVDLLIVLVNYALAMLGIAWIDRRRPAGGGGTVSMSTALRACLVATGALVGWAALSVALLDPPGGSAVRIAALQPGHHRRDVGPTPKARDRAMLDLLGAQTRKAALQGAQLIVWPEGALSADPTVSYSDEIAGLARASGAYLFVGYGIHTASGFRNEVLTVAPNGAFLGTYGKDHPVVFMGETSITRGKFPTYETPLGTLGAIICYDMDFTDTAREVARRGAKVIAVPSADWAAIATKHYTLSVFRALETGAAIAKSEYEFDSAIVDASGRIVASAVAPHGSEAVLVADVSLRSGVPLATRLGDWIGWLCVGGLLFRTVVRLYARTSPGRRETSSSSYRSTMG